MADPNYTGVAGIYFDDPENIDARLAKKGGHITPANWRLGVTKTLACLEQSPCQTSIEVLSMIADRVVRRNKKELEEKFPFPPQYWADLIVTITPDLKGADVLDGTFSPGETDEDDSGGPTIEFTPQYYDNPAEKPSSLRHADEALLHELVHCVRELYRLDLDDTLDGFQPAPRLDQQYDNLGEFCAVVIANIYRSENVRPNLRRDHHGYLPLAKDLSIPSAFVDFWRPALLRIQSEFAHTAFFGCIARVTCAFNPFAELQRRQLAVASPKGK
jgi:hypothetical protein